MVQSYEKDGIVYFKEPCRVDAVEWDADHAGCDSVILGYKGFEEEGEIIYVVCYATRPEFNGRIAKLAETLDGYPEPLGVECGFSCTGNMVTLFETGNEICS